MTYHLSMDIGASSGRAILGSLKDGTLQLEEIYRFENYIQRENGTLVWDIPHLRNAVINGIAKCRELDKIPKTVAVDTWGVDYVLLDWDGQALLPAVSYRDARTFAVSDEVAARISQEDLYARTGIQKQNFNTLYQLYCDKKSGKLAKAKTFLMIPDFIAYTLTGVMKNEYTNATTTNLVNAEAKTWDHDILRALELPEDIFLPLAKPGTFVGRFNDATRAAVGFDAEVICAPSHDTASAVCACPLRENSVYISSGTWSLIGTETPEPILIPAARDANFTNEGGVEYRFRFLKNIMGMWLLQNIRRDLNKSLSYDQMMHLAMHSDYPSTINPNDPQFVAPDNMLQAVRQYLHDDRLPVGDVLHAVYHSLAQSYADAVREIEQISGKVIDTVNIVGGGSKDAYLNSLTRQYTGKRVFAGPVEATAIGNLVCHLMYEDKSLTLKKARALVQKSLDIQEVK